MDLQQAIILRDKTIAKQQTLFNLQIPSTRYSKQDLRNGMQRRVQRREHKKFLEQVKKQKSIYDKQKKDLDKYISSLQDPQPTIDFEESTITSPIPKVNFLGIPIQRKVRNIRKRGR